MKNGSQTMEERVLIADDLQQKFVFFFKRQVEGALLNLRGRSILSIQRARGLHEIPFRG
jgi:hypothetical protein